mgnify:CR=1 FL=1
MARKNEPYIYKVLRRETPNPRQQAFFRAEAANIAYDGARGGGKSWAMRRKLVMLAMRYPGLKLLLLRRTLPELRANHILPLQRELAGYAAWSGAERAFRFPNGSRLVMGYCDSDSDCAQYQGQEYEVIGFEEATNFEPDWLTFIATCLRTTRTDFTPRIYYTCNPGGEGHAWVKRLFIDRRFKEGEEPEEHSFIQSLITDNTALMEADPQYIKQLEVLPPKLRDAWLYGNWEIFEGQFFEDFRTEPDMRAAEAHGESLTAEELRAQRRWVHVIEPFDLNAGSCRGWRIMRSYDFGYGKPFSCAWWAIDYDGVIYRILELYGCTGTPNEGVRWTPDQQFAEIARIEREHPWLRGKKIEGVADPAIWDASRGESIADTAARYGLYFTKGDNERIPGWMQCHYRLQFDEEGYSRMYVFSNCAAFIRTVPGMMFSRTAPEDLDTEMEDHVCDEWRYMCMSRPVAPLRPVERRVMMNDPLGRY